MVQVTAEGGEPQDRAKSADGRKRPGESASSAERPASSGNQPKVWVMLGLPMSRGLYVATCSVVCVSPTRTQQGMFAPFFVLNMLLLNCCWMPGCRPLLVRLICHQTSAAGRAALRHDSGLRRPYGAAAEDDAVRRPAADAGQPHRVRNPFCPSSRHKSLSTRRPGG